MIIGVDETGNFDENSSKRHLFVSVVIQTEGGRLDSKLNQFENWEKKLPDSLKNAKGEVKGSSLKEHHIESFMKEVYLREPFVFSTYVSVVPSEISTELIEKHRLFEVKQLEYTYEKFKILGSKKKNLNLLSQYPKWLAKRSTREYLKMLCLGHCLQDVLYNGMVRFILEDKIDELLDIQYKIDQDFLNDENVYWSNYLRKTIQERSSKKPFPVLDTWDENHPLLRKYSIEMPEGKKGINLNSIFKDNFNFLNSHEHAEIRIADIVAIILNRFWNRKELKWANSIIEKTHCAKDAHIELRLNDFDVEEKYNELIENDVDKEMLNLAKSKQRG